MATVKPNARIWASTQDNEDDLFTITKYITRTV